MLIFRAISVLALSGLLFSINANAKAKDCTLSVEEPVIHYYRTDGLVLDNRGNTVNDGVLARLSAKGFEISTAVKTAYVMETEVRCGPKMTFFGPQDFCQTEVIFYKSKPYAKVYSSGPTAPMPGLNLDFNQIFWPSCEELK